MEHIPLPLTDKLKFPLFLIMLCEVVKISESSRYYIHLALHLHSTHAAQMMVG